MIKGVDVSHWKTGVPWDKMKADGVQFMLAKAMTGLGTKDAMFENHIAGARAQGILVGAYHWFKPGESGQEQAKCFLDYVSKFDLDLPLVLDWEESNAESNAESKELECARAYSFLDYVESQTKTRAMVYCNLSWPEEMGIGLEFKRFLLWLACYRGIAPAAPKPWTSYAIWQNSERGVEPGIRGTYDTDQFNGSLEDLRGLKANAA